MNVFNAKAARIDVPLAALVDMALSETQHILIRDFISEKRGKIANIKSNIESVERTDNVRHVRCLDLKLQPAYDHTVRME